MNRFMCLVLALVCAMGGQVAAEDKAAPAAAAATPIVVYDTALGGGWENWSWAKTELSLEIAGSARRPIKVEAEAWQALYLHHEPFSTAGLKQLRLLIQGSAPDGQVRVLALIAGKAVGDGHPVKLSNTGWTRVIMPLAELGVDDKSIDGVWVQNATGNPLPKFYVTEIVIE